MPEKLIHQINVRLPRELYEELEKQALAERRPMGELVRLALEWVAPHIRRSGTLEALRGPVPGKTYSRRVSQELQDHLHSALDLIFERAPSTVIERVSEFLTERAGKYGESK